MISFDREHDLQEKGFQIITCNNLEETIPIDVLEQRVEANPCYAVAVVGGDLEPAAPMYQPKVPSMIAPKAPMQQTTTRSMMVAPTNNQNRSQPTPTLEEECNRAYEELASSHEVCSDLQKKLQLAEQQLAQSKAESYALRKQCDEVKAATNGVQPFTMSARTVHEDRPSELVESSLAFATWQNAHLQGDLRFAHNALAHAKSQLQMQMLRNQTLENQMTRLPERIAHLEMDLGFRERFGYLPDKPAGRIGDIYGDG